MSKAKIKYKIASQIPGEEWFTGEFSTFDYMKALKYAANTVGEGLSACILHIEHYPFHEMLIGSETYEANTGWILEYDVKYLENADYMAMVES